MPREQPPGYLQTADRALQVLGAFTPTTPSWGVSELARALRLDKSQVQRLLATLAYRGFLVTDPVSRRYQLGPTLVALGRLAEANDGVTRAVRDLLAPLAGRTGESVVFNVPDANRYRCAAAVDGPGPLRYATIVGQLFPGHGGAGGHAIFAFLPEERVRGLFGTALERFSPTTPTTIDELLAIHADVRDQGLAVSDGEYDQRVEAVAAPVFAQATVLGAVSVIGARDSVHPHLDRIIAEVRRTAREMTAALAIDDQPATQEGPGHGTGPAQRLAHR